MSIAMQQRRIMSNGEWENPSMREWVRGDAVAAISALHVGDRLPGGLVVVPEKATPRMIAEGESAASYGIGKPNSEEDIPMVWERMVGAAGGEYA